MRYVSVACHERQGFAACWIIYLPPQRERNRVCPGRDAYYVRARGRAAASLSTPENSPKAVVKQDSGYGHRSIQSSVFWVWLQALCLPTGLQHHLSTGTGLRRRFIQDVRKPTAIGRNETEENYCQGCWVAVKQEWLDEARAVLH